LHDSALLMLTALALHKRERAAAERLRTAKRHDKAVPGIRPGNRISDRKCVRPPYAGSCGDCR